MPAWKSFILRTNKTSVENFYLAITSYCSTSRPPRCDSDSKSAMTDDLQSELAHVTIEKNCQPLELFAEWINEFKECTRSGMVTFSLATASTNGDVSNRTLVLRRLLEDSFVFSTNGNSRKICQIKENPKAAACFLFSYEKGNKKVSRQVLIEGKTEPLPKSFCEEIFNEEPLYCKIRSHICNQGKTVDWDELKKKHDALLHEVKTNHKQLEMPDSMIAYKIVPQQLDFYHSYSGQIADRILFEKDPDNCQWNHRRISA